jgi:hypothetical protein
LDSINLYKSTITKIAIAGALRAVEKTATGGCIKEGYMLLPEEQSIHGGGATNSRFDWSSD